MNDSALMQAALEQARLALQLAEVPVGCVVLHIPSDQNHFRAAQPPADAFRSDRASAGNTRSAGG